jgi:hypothetical protein
MEQSAFLLTEVAQASACVRKARPNVWGRALPCQFESPPSGRVQPYWIVIVNAADSRVPA